MAAVEADTKRAEDATPHWTTLRVADAARIAEGIHRYELLHPGGQELPAFTAGSHIALLTPSGRVRKFSLCNDPAERSRYVIAVKQEAGGRGGSTSLVEGLAAGALVMVTRPENAFELDEGAQVWLFIAGGIGITPIMSMMRRLKSTGRERFRLCYCTRNAAATAFLDELQGPAFRDHVTIHHDHGEAARAFDFRPLLERRAGVLYCCGPRPLMEAVRDLTGHWPRAAVHFESFVDADQTRTVADRAFRVRLARSGAVVEVPAHLTILEALRARGHEVASSCESGSCGACRTGLLAGAADHRDVVLSDAQRARSIMVCISRAVSDELTLDL